MNRICSDKIDDRSRRGVTLVEVLMALMIMSVGVASVAVLFPISVLRTAQATQMTNAAIVRYNFEILADIHPELIFDPDRDGNLVEHFRGAGRNYLIDPVGFYTRAADGNAGFASFGFDPNNNLPSLPRWGGNLSLTNGATVTTAGAVELEALRLAALDFAGQGDGWDTQIDAQPAGLVAGGVMLPADLDLTQVPSARTVLPQDGSGGYLIADPENYRIVMFSDNGRFSHIAPLVGVDTATNTAYYSEDVNSNGSLDTLEDVNMNGTLDARFLPNEMRVDLDGDGVKEPSEAVVSRVLLQSRKVADYSWMLNVRRRSDGYARQIDVVVRFNDGVDLTEERLFEATFVPLTNIAWVRLPSRINASDTTEPKISKGKFIFDATNAVWYRVQEVRESPLADFDFQVLLQEQVRSSDGAGASTPGAGPTAGGPYGAAMFPKGIVDVYPMGARNIPESLQSQAF